MPFSEGMVFFVPHLAQAVPIGYIPCHRSMKHLRFNNLRRSLGRWLCAGLFFLPMLAQAHPGHLHPGEDDEFDALTSGFVHPFSGIDHLLLALAVGWYAFSRRTGGKFANTGLFLTALAAGAVAGRGSQGGAGLEIAIALTMLGAGALLLLKKSQNPNLVVVAAMVAGIIHGFAHGSEAPAAIPFFAYATGLLAGTATLAGVGGLLQKVTRNRSQPVAFAAAVLVAVGSLRFFHAL